MQREPISLADALGDEELPVKMAYVPMADTGRQQRTMGRGLPWLCHKCGSWLLSHLVIWLLRLLSCLWARLLAYLLSRTLPVGLTVSPPPPFLVRGLASRGPCPKVVSPTPSELAPDGVWRRHFEVGQRLPLRPEWRSRGGTSGAVAGIIVLPPVYFFPWPRGCALDGWTASQPTRRGDLRKTTTW